MNNKKLMMKYAVNYLSRYNSSKKNLERLLKRKIMRLKDTSTEEKVVLNKYILEILNELESKNIINDKEFVISKINNFFTQGKSKNFIILSLLKKGLIKELIEDSLQKFELDNPEWELNSAQIFAKKKRLGKYGKQINKEKDLAKMARAGFSYEIANKIFD